MKYFDITEFGAASGGTLCTAVLQKALDSARDAGGGTVVIPQGRFVSGTFRIHGDTTLRLESGAVLAASKSIEDYTEVPYGRIKQEKKNRVWIYAHEARNITIEGSGTLDLRGSSFMKFGEFRTGPVFTADTVSRMNEQQQDDAVCGYRERPQWPVLFTGCEGVKFNGITIADSPAWTVRFSLCRDLVIRGIRILNDLRVPNSDGLHFNSCRDVLVSDSIFRCGDDCIAVTGIGSEDVPAERIIVRGCVFASRSSAIRLGHENATVRDCIFTDCIVTDSNRALGIFARGEGGLVERCVFRNFRISTRLHAGNWWGHGEPVVAFALDGARIRDLEISGVRASSEQGAVFLAESGGSVSGLVLENFVLELQKGESSDLMGGVLDLQPAPVRERDIPGFLISGVSRTRLRDLELVWKGEKAPYFSKAFEISGDAAYDPQSLRERSEEDLDV